LLCVWGELTLSCAAMFSARFAFAASSRDAVAFTAAAVLAAASCSPRAAATAWRAFWALAFAARVRAGR
jgi:hypothetical protein